MNTGTHELTLRQILFIIFIKTLDFRTLFAATILLFCSLFVIKHNVLKIITLFLFFVATVIFLNLASSPVFVQYFLALPSMGILKVYFVQILGAIRNIGRPSKSMPGINLSQVKLVEFFSKHIFITRYYFYYAKKLQIKLLKIARIYILILMLPDRQLRIHYPKVDENHRIIKGLAD